MPELPEVETMRRGIADLRGATIVEARFPVGRCRPLTIQPDHGRLAALLRGTRVGTIERRGKRVAIGIEGMAAPHWLVIEPRMTGLLLVADPPTEKHLRMELSLGADAPHRRLLFWDQRGLGTIRLLDAAGLDRACGPGVLGPDGLVVTPADLSARLARSRRAVKVALLDQRVVAGIGNIYAAEILHRAGVDPRCACHRLGGEAIARIAAAARRILGTAVEHEGSSIGDELYRTADNRKGRFQRLHRVYGREGLACRGCGGPIERIVQAQRSTFFCPACQRPPSRRGLVRGRRGA
jgi:formamidopyrimidine-DNA glycosylase